jgi:hypothetical protein
MQSRLTINCMPQYSADFGKLTAFLRSLDPSAIVVSIDSMNAANRVYELQKALPNAKIIARYVFPQDGGMHTKPQAAGDLRKYVVSPLDAINAWGDLGRDGRMLYLANEPQANGATQDDIGRLSAWLLESIAIAGDRGISLCVANFGVGHPALMGNGEYDARFDDVLTALSKNRERHALGMHVYQPADTFTRLDGLIKRCKTLDITPPRVHITEAGFDAGSGGDALNGYRSRGFSGQQFAAFMVDKVKNVYAPYIADDVLQSVAVFCWGGGASWKNFDVESDIDWQTTILDAANKGLLSVPSKPVTKPFLTPVPMPTDAGSAIRIRVTNTQGINLRSGPSTDYQTAGSLENGHEVTLYQVPFKQASNGQLWRWVSVDEKLGGWVNSDALTYVAVVVAPPPVIPLPAPAETPPPVVIPDVPPLPLPTAETFYLMSADDRAKMLTYLIGMTNILIGLQETTVSKAA